MSLELLTEKPYIRISIGLGGQRKEKNAAVG